MIRPYQQLNKKQFIETFFENIWVNVIKVYTKRPMIWSKKRVPRADLFKFELKCLIASADFWVRDAHVWIKLADNGTNVADVTVKIINELDVGLTIWGREK